MVCADFAKAFDKVDISILLDRLRELGLTTHLMCLLTSYLVSRKNIVYYVGHQSKPYISTSGVPQVSNLDCVFLQRNIEYLVQWCEDNRLQLNTDKCCILTLTRSKDAFTFDYNISGQTLDKKT